MRTLILLSQSPSDSLEHGPIVAGCRMRLFPAANPAAESQNGDKSQCSLNRVCVCVRRPPSAEEGRRTWKKPREGSAVGRQF